MKITLTHLEAWDDFWKWIRKQPKWKDIPRTGKYGKQYMYKTQKAWKEGGLGIDRVSAILSLHAKDRYDFVVMINEEDIGGFSGEWKRGNDVFEVAPDGYVNDVLDIVAKSLGFEDEEA